MTNRLTESHVEAAAHLFVQLIDIVARLRGEDGCPWDREQTRDSVKMNLVEEAFEALDAINKSDSRMLASELGDLLMQVVFHARMSEEMGEFDIRDVLCAVIEKLVRRHPHVFGEAAVKDSKEVLRNWEQIKKAERGARSVLADIPESLPGFLRALVVQDKVGRVGFEWPDSASAMSKVEEELQELRSAIEGGNRERIEAEYGDLLLIALNLGRYLGANPDDVLRAAIRRFERRFRYVEIHLAQRGLSPEEAGLEAMDSLWDESKSTEADGGDAELKRG